MTHRVFCQAPDCTEESRVRGLCQRHYGQAYYRAIRTHTCIEPGCDRDPRENWERAAACPEHDRTHTPAANRHRHKHTHPPAVCKNPGCDRPHRAKGLCQVHYHRARRREITQNPKSLKQRRESMLANLEAMYA